jgi:hypothetical protein
MFRSRILSPLFAYTEYYGAAYNPRISSRNFFSPRFLAAFAKLRKATINFVISVCLSVCPSDRPSVRQFVRPSVRLAVRSSVRPTVIPSDLRPSLCRHGTARFPPKRFSCNLIFEFFRKSFQKINIPLKSDKNSGNFT